MLGVDLEKVIFDMDSYKLSQFVQYPKGTRKIISYGEPRGSKNGNSAIVFFGLQFILKTLEKRITKEDVIVAKAMYLAHGEPFNEEGWMYIVNDLDGKLPLKIKAVEEGTLLPLSNVAFIIENTDDKCYWLTSLVETMLLRVWYPSTVATNSFFMKRIIAEHMIKTIGNTEGIQYKLHDFGARGVSSRESAILGGSGHLVNFVGTDTTIALFGLKSVYKENCAGQSLPASEHSTITSWGRENEVEAYNNMIEQFGNGFIFACVSDSFDIDNAVQNLWGGVLRDKVINMYAKLIVRPDSGDTVEGVITILKQLNESFGSTINSKGFKVLNKVGVIQGDGVNPITLKLILDRMTEEGYSTDNIAFGMGGALCQQVDRDTYQWAMKCCSIQLEGGSFRDVYKEPKGSFKKSKRGILGLFNRDGVLSTEKIDYMDMDSDDNMLKTVFENGEIVREFTLSEVRERVNKQI